MNEQNKSPPPQETNALRCFNALWYGIEKHMGVDPDCAKWPDIIRTALTNAENVRTALEAIIGYADVALANPELFGGIEAVRNLRGPAFDDARKALAAA